MKTAIFLFAVVCQSDCYQKNGYKIAKTVHRLVAITFILNPKNKPEVNHINANTFDNRVENLEWVTHEENVIHAIKMGKMGRRIKA